MRDHTEVVREIRAQNWKVGGALVVDVPEAETAVFDLLQEAAALIHERCLAAAEQAIAERIGTSNIGIHEARGAEIVLNAIRNIRTEV